MCMPLNRKPGQSPLSLLAPQRGHTQRHPEHWVSFHFIVDLSFVLLCLGVATYLCWGWHCARRDLSSAQYVPAAAQQSKRDALREQSRRLMEGLGQTIAGQLRSWKLSLLKTRSDLKIQSAGGPRRAIEDD